jgi:hypothetical protein
MLPPTVKMLARAVTAHGPRDAANHRNSLVIRQMPQVLRLFAHRHDVCKLNQYRIGIVLGNTHPCESEEVPASAGAK